MPYGIIETENGLTVVEHPEGMTAGETAKRQGAIVIDPGPYDTYEDACDALIGLQEELEDEESSDVPGTQAMEGRYETGD